MSLMCIKSRPAGSRNPKSPMRTAACIMCIRRFSFDLAMNPRITNSNPNAAGIKAVGAFVPSKILNPNPVIPTRISKTPVKIEVEGIRKISP